MTVRRQKSLLIVFAATTLATTIIVPRMCCLTPQVQAWTPVSTFRGFDGRRQSQRLHAKPPPVSLFDLDEIEKMERQLDAAAVNLDRNDDDDDDDGDSMDDDLELPPPQDSQDAVKLFTVPEEFHNQRIDAVLSALDDSQTRSQWGHLVTQGNVVQLVLDEDKKQQQVITRKSFKVSADMVLQVTVPPPEIPSEIVAQDLPLEILFEDEHMIVLNKAAGMVVHPAAGNWDGTVVNALAHHLSKSPYGSGEFCQSNEETDVLSEDGEPTWFRPGIVHRLDKGTTGVLVVAKTKTALSKLSEAFASRSVKKTYLAITVGNPGRQVRLDKPIGRHPVHRQRMRVVPDPHRKDSSGVAPKDRLILQKSPSQRGRRALSFVDMLAFDGKLSVVQVRIETGRTHQIRVHLQDRHTPIYGDDVYGIADWNKKLLKTHQIARPLLHAFRLEMDHPVSGEPMVFTAPMAADMFRVARTIWPEGIQERPDVFMDKHE